MWCAFVIEVLGQTYMHWKKLRILSWVRLCSHQANWFSQFDRTWNLDRFSLLTMAGKDYPYIDKSNPTFYPFWNFLINVAQMKFPYCDVNVHSPKSVSCNSQVVWNLLICSQLVNSFLLVSSI